MVGAELLHGVVPPADRLGGHVDGPGGVERALAVFQRNVDASGVYTRERAEETKGHHDDEIAEIIQNTWGRNGKKA